jgi:hypothetical protein
MKKAGILLIALGIFSLFLAFNMYFVFENQVYMSGVQFLLSSMLLGFGVGLVAYDESKNLKTFVLWTFLTLITLVVTIIIVSVMQAGINTEFSALKMNTELSALKFWRAEQAIQSKNATSEAWVVEQAERDKRKSLEANSDNFIDNKNGTVSFKSNGLMWQKCSVGQTWNGETCIGEDKKMSWDDAMKLSNSFAGYDDWRLPTKEELMTLVYCSDGRYTKQGFIICENYLSVNQPTINLNYFPNTHNDWYWSSSSYTNNASNAWLINFIYGESNYGYKSGNNFVRLVR